MKFKLLLCGAALLVAGCSSTENPYASSGDYSYNYDLVPQPLMDPTPVDLDKLYLLPPATTADSSSGVLNPPAGGSNYSDL
jgi:hypothetical protein